MTRLRQTQQNIYLHDQLFFPINIPAAFWAVVNNSMLCDSTLSCKLQRPLGCCSSTSHNQCLYFQLSTNEFLKQAWKQAVQRWQKNHSQRHCRDDSRPPELIKQSAITGRTWEMISSIVLSGSFKWLQIWHRQKEINHSWLQTGLCTRFTSCMAANHCTPLPNRCDINNRL